MSEGPSRITGPIPPDPTLFPDYYRRPLSARGRLEGNALKLDLCLGPLPLDSSLSPTCFSARLSRPPPRIKPNAKDILEMGQKGTVGVLLQLDGISLCQESPVKRLDCKDHEKENLKRLREIQRKCREKEQARELSQPKPMKALWKSQKYENVKSKVKATLQERERAKEDEVPDIAGKQSRSSQGNAWKEVQEEGKKVDFISHNAQNAKRTQLRRSRSMQSLAEVLEQKRKEQDEYNAKQKGHLPRYLIERKAHWRKEAEERQRNMPDPAMPPGHAMMPENQRLETLDSIKQTQEQLLKDLLLLPVRTDTLSVQNRRANLEKKLSQIEEALKIFSRPKVFIKLDS